LRNFLIVMMMRGDRIERSEIRVVTGGTSPGLRFAPSGLRLAHGGL
jgi:hypothetical protein